MDDFRKNALGEVWNNTAEKRERASGLARIFIRIVGLKSTAFIGGTFLVVQYLKKVPLFLEKVPLEIVTLKLQLYYKRFSD